jgi:uncharacterized membrane protein YdjX (TVP38/TMEM64 family)
LPAGDGPVWRRAGAIGSPPHERKQPTIHADRRPSAAGAPAAATVPARGITNVSAPPTAFGTLKRYGPLIAVVAIMALAFALGWHRLITLETVVTVRERFHGFLNQHMVLSLLVYVVVYVLIVALSIPCGLILTLTGGLLFGWLVGAVATVLAATTGATVVFLIARSSLGTAVAETAGPWLEKFRRGFEEEGVRYMLFLRLVPFPFWAVNLAPALLGIPLRTYVVGTFFGIIPGVVAFSYLGATLDRVIGEAKNSFEACVAAKGAGQCQLAIGLDKLPTTQILIALTLIGLVALIPVALKKWRRRHAAAE